MIHIYYYLNDCSVNCYLYNRIPFSTPLESWQRSHVSVNCWVKKRWWMSTLHVLFAKKLFCKSFFIFTYCLNKGLDLEKNVHIIYFKETSKKHPQYQASCKPSCLVKKMIKSIWVKKRIFQLIWTDFRNIKISFHTLYILFSYFLNISNLFFSESMFFSVPVSSDNLQLSSRVIYYWRPCTKNCIQNKVTH